MSMLSSPYLESGELALDVALLFSNN